MKKGISIILTALMVVTLFAGCGNQKEDTGKFQIGVVQIVEHTSLNTIRETMVEELIALGIGDQVEIDYKNASGDQNNLNTICQKFASDKKDLIVAIATPSAQAAVNATEEIPVVFSAVTDPVSAGLLNDLENPNANATGTSDYVDAEKILDLALKITPEIKTIGFIYSSSEANSKVVIEKAKTYVTSKGLKYEEIAVTNLSEVQQAGISLAGKVDAMFAPIDNTIASAMDVLSEVCVEKKVPFYVSADSMVADGGFATEGIDYVDLGKETAAIIKQIYEGKKVADIPVVILKDTKTYINKTIAGKIGVTIPDDIAGSAEFFE